MFRSKKLIGNIHAIAIFLNHLQDTVNLSSGDF